MRENKRDIAKADRQGQQTLLLQDGSIRGRLRVHPALTTTTELSRGWRTFVSDEVVDPGGGLSGKEGGLNNLPERAQFRLSW